MLHCQAAKLTQNWQRRGVGVGGNGRGGLGGGGGGGEKKNGNRAQGGDGGKIRVAVCEGLDRTSERVLMCTRLT